MLDSGHLVSGNLVLIKTLPLVTVHYTFGDECGLKNVRFIILIIIMFTSVSHRCSPLYLVPACPVERTV